MKDLQQLLREGSIWFGDREGTISSEDAVRKLEEGKSQTTNFYSTTNHSSPSAPPASTAVNDLLLFSGASERGEFFTAVDAGDAEGGNRGSPKNFLSSPASSHPTPHYGSPLLAPFFVNEIDRLLGGGLAFGALHEWGLDFSLSQSSKNSWCAPLLILSQLVGNTFSVFSSSEQTSVRAQFLRGHLIAWVGARCWPTPMVLNKTLGENSFSEQFQQSGPKHSLKGRFAKHQHIFLNPSSRSQRLWTITHLLRSHAALIVIADGSGFSLQDTRRLQLAAQRGNVLALLCRPPEELQRPSTATSRWKVTPVSAAHEKQTATLHADILDSPSWILELVRFRGMPAPQQWFLSWVESDETSAFHLSSAAFAGVTETTRKENSEHERDGTRESKKQRRSA